MLDVSVVIPVRNAEQQLDECLASIMRCEPREIIVVDGNSTDRTLSIARKYPVRILSDDGRGLPVARLLGAGAACSHWVALIDSDVVVPEGALELLLTEFVEGGYTALQAGLSSVGGPGYWGRALANHHRTGRSKDWFGLVATVFEREALLEIGFDPTFGSGEDIEVRWRLVHSGARIGVSKRTFVTHRFSDTFEFAREQWDADGRGLARMIRKHRLRGTLLLALPLAAGIRGIALSLVRRQPSWTLYYACFTVFNYVAMVAELGRRPNEDRTLVNARGLGG